MRRGLTLLELVVTMSIVAVVLGISAPRLGAVRDHLAVRGALTDVGALFSRARELAMTRREPVAIVFDSAAGLVQLRSGGSMMAQRPLRRLYGVLLGVNHDSVVYDPRGLGFGLSNLTVTIRRGAFVDTLRMSRLGRVRW